MITRIEKFVNAALAHSDATKEGAYEIGNESVTQIERVVSSLKADDKIGELLGELGHESFGVRVWAARFLIFEYEDESRRTLEEIANSESFFALTADLTLKEWQSGSLKAIDEY